MEKALYKGATLYAYQVVADFNLETEIRESAKHMHTNPILVCHDCNEPVFLRAGKKVTEYFAHTRKSECKYGEYCRKQSSIFKHIQTTFAPILGKIATENDFTLEEDVSIIKDHYTAFVIKNDSKSYAIDIIDSGATASTLENRRKKYGELGYEFLMVIADKNAESEPFSERYMAYYPVKYSLNTSLNHTALVIDDCTKEWFIYVFDNTKSSPEVNCEEDWNVNDTFAMKISIADIRFNPTGFHTETSNILFSDFCNSRKKRKEEWLHEQDVLRYKRAEEQKRFLREQEIRRNQTEESQKEEKRRAEEQRAKAAEAKAQVEAVKEVERQKRAEAKKAEIQKTYQQTGKFAGEVVKGKQTYLSIEEITSQRPSANWIRVYGKEEFENIISEIRSHKSYAVKQLFAKMCFISPEELRILKQMYDELSISDTEMTVIIDTLMIKAGLSF